MTLTNVSPQTFDYFSALNSAITTGYSATSSASDRQITPTSYPHNPFDHSHNSHYSSERALALGYLSELTYCSRRLVERTLCDDWGFDTVEFFPLGPTDAFLAADAHKIIVAFRGSDDRNDWLHNLNLDLVQGPAQGRVHRGFLRILGTVWQEIRRSICRLRAQARWQGRELSLWFTGHSLGGALATLTVAQLREAGENIDGLYTFASPRVGDRSFARNFNIDFGFKTFRVVNKNDLVPKLPGRFLSYHHVGQLHYFDRNGQRHTHSTAFFRFLDGLKVHANDLFDLDFSAAENHDIGPYLDMLYRDYHRDLQALHVARVQQQSGTQSEPYNLEPHPQDHASLSQGMRRQRV